jgi:hypothetical protein
VPRLVVANIIAILATLRAIALHVSGRDKKWHKTTHIFPLGLVG